MLKITWTHINYRIFVIAIILGVICGFIMILFNYLLFFFKTGFSFIPYFLAPMLATLLTSLLVKYGRFERIMGTGSDQFIKEITLSDLDYKKVPNSIAKTFATSCTFGSGMICGLEGPGLLIGANLGVLFSKKNNPNRINYSFIGASACTAAILKVPISGALFCAELPYNNYIHYKSLIPSIISSTIAYIFFCFVFGFAPLISTQLTTAPPESINYILLFPILIIFGIIMGVFVALYTIFLKSFTNQLKKNFEKKIGLWILPLFGGTFYGIFLLLIIPYINFTYSEELLHPDVSFLNVLTNYIHNIPWIHLLFFSIAILIAIILSIGTLNSAGIIMPLMIIGGILGGLFGLVFYPENPELFVLLGISATLGAATNNPIAAIFIIVEMTWVPLLFIPAGITTVVAYIISGSSSIIPGQYDIER
ncbi:MAG: chloride channel protein [Promethearchaeota archaeon]